MVSSAHPPEPVTVAVFARAPVPGRVKTRLARAIGDAAAAVLHERLVERAVATACAGGGGGVELWCAPDARHPFFERCAERFGVSLHVQCEGDLGARMAYAFAQHAGQPLVLIGADCPALEPGDLRDAALALRSHDAVFAPAEDGGYVLVALARPAPVLFRDVAWGSADVMRTTREHARRAGLTLAELRTLWDVDRPEDLARLEREALLA
jgi:rSAM/selenodomain-associated transferase 1